MSALTTTALSFLSPINIQKWIDEHRNLLKPPVGNQVIYKNTDFIVMVVGGPNSRKDFHINPTEELYYQLEGQMTLRIIQDGQPEDIRISPGEMFLLPRNIPHCPLRKARTVGIVIERQRPEGESDRICFYCEKCCQVLHQAEFAREDNPAQMKKIMNRFWSSKALTTCKTCGAVMKQPSPVGIVA